MPANWQRNSETGEYNYNKPQPRMMDMMAGHLYRDRDNTIKMVNENFTNQMRLLQNRKMSDREYEQGKFSLQQQYINNTSQVKQRFQSAVQPYQQIQKMVDEGTMTSEYGHQAMQQLGLPRGVKLPATGEKPIGVETKRRPFTASNIEKNLMPAANTIVDELLSTTRAPAEKIPLIGGMIAGYKSRHWWAPGVMERTVSEKSTIKGYLAYRGLTGYAGMTAWEQEQADRVWEARMAESGDSVKWNPNNPQIKRIRQRSLGGLGRAASQSTRINRTPLNESYSGPFERTIQKRVTKPVSASDPFGILK